MHNVPSLELDHLVVAARTLDEGARFVTEALGIELLPGGKHAGMGTHNRVLGLFGGAYLEVIAIDPDAEAHPASSSPATQRPGMDGVARARWFELDRPAMRERLERGPFLAHWAARVSRPRDLARWQSQYPSRIPPAIAMSRGVLTWRLTVPDDGSFPAWQGAGDGVVPTLIQWDTPAHPGATLPSSGVALKTLKARHPQPELAAAQLNWLGAAHLIVLDGVPAPAPALVAEFETPSGVRMLG
ncbi:VOC family protein [Trinickia caryophylli]|uniref:Glyoxalase-like domain-containing protein n=1 Tax=Trinickia caryophylli TaxID=28094 RepID=A0A1X7GZY2_TRICW|nr:VOC family protein [Trinickia caryophylli]PMS10081.1 VOC family protein [Trinickia caryophylli]TRX18175.1 VOC family protein [Trinickia caryophylli]WQE11037.1 VOC family protein [Trinickia caryophylli]SMF77213.1 Glyoxalase-like domain-containing protein [Trinickia caryophylli]GLU35343.1 glyoxalase [Trinickia caryophylli]